MWPTTPGAPQAPRPRRRRQSEREAAPGTPPMRPNDSRDARPARRRTGISRRNPAPHLRPRSARRGRRPAVGDMAPVSDRAVTSPAASQARWIRAGWPMLDGRSDDPEICPFLRAAAAGRRAARGPDGGAESCEPLRRAARGGAPIASAAGARLPGRRPCQLSALSSWRRGHRRSAGGPGPGRPLVQPGGDRFSVLVLVMATSASLVFVMARGGLELAGGGPNGFTDRVPGGRGPGLRDPGAHDRSAALGPRRLHRPRRPGPLPSPYPSLTAPTPTPRPTV